MRLKTALIVGSSVAGLMGLFVVACDSATCGTGTHDSGGGVCVADMPDLSMPVMPSASCGTNNAVDSMTKACEITAAACGPGTILEPVTHTCKIKVNLGTKIWTGGFIQTAHFIFYQGVDGDGGTTLLPVGDSSGITSTAVTDTTKLFMKNGDPLGLQAMIPVHWFSGPPSWTFTAIDHQITWGEYKTCVGSWEVYKDLAEREEELRRHHRHVRLPARRVDVLVGYLQHDPEPGRPHPRRPARWRAERVQHQPRRHGALGA